MSTERTGGSARGPMRPEPDSLARAQVTIPSQPRAIARDRRLMLPGQVQRNGAGLCDEAHLLRRVALCQRHALRTVTLEITADDDYAAHIDDGSTSAGLIGMDANSHDHSNIHTVEVRGGEHSMIADSKDIYFHVAAMAASVEIEGGRAHPRLLRRVVASTPRHPAIIGVLATERGAEVTGHSGTVVERSDPLELGDQLGLDALKATMFGRPKPIRRIDRYRVIEELGRGGMGVVLRAVDEQLDRLVAIKILPAERSGSQEQRARLAREARALAKLSHPAVVQIYDVGDVDGALWVAMEHVDGRTLRAWLEELRPKGPRWRTVLPTLLEAGEGLRAAHDASLVHRDFKPDNVMVTPDGRARVLDFGLARLGEGVDDPSASMRSASAGTLEDGARPSAEGLSTLTRPGQIAGTPAYMAPEQLRGERPDPRCDQFAFCVTVWEAVYGRRPFASHETNGLALFEDAVFRGHLDVPAKGAAPRWLEYALRRGLSVEPAARWPDMATLLELLHTQPLRRRRRAGIALAAVSVAGALGIGTTLTNQERCAIDATALLGVWDDEQRAAMQTAFEASSLPFAPQAFVQASTRLDAWATAWIAGQREACEATHVTGVQSEAVLDRRTACLGRQRAELTGLVELLTSPTPTLLLELPQVLDQLPDVAVCEDAERSSERFATPVGAEAEALDDAAQSLARARALVHAGMLAEAEATITALVTATADLDHPPLRLSIAALDAERLLVAHRLDEGSAALLAVTREAEILELDELVASTRSTLAVRLVGSWSKPELEAMLLADADVALRRLQRAGDAREVALARAHAYAAQARGEHAAARDAFERGLARAESLALSEADALRLELAGSLIDVGELSAAATTLAAAREAALATWGPRSPAYAHVQQVLAELELARERYPEAREHLDAALALERELFGSRSIEVGASQLVAAKLAMVTGDLDRARELVEPLVELYTEAYGPTHFSLVEIHNAVGVLRYFAGDYTGSIASYEHALRISEAALGPDHPDTALLHSNIGESLLALGRLDAAVAELDRAIESLAERGAEHEPMLALPLKGRGQARLRLGRVDDAIADLERALAIAEASSGEPIERAEIMAALAEALHARGGDQARAHELATRATTQLRTLGFDERAAEIERLHATAPATTPTRTEGEPRPTSPP